VTKIPKKSKKPESTEERIRRRANSIRNYLSGQWVDTPRAERVATLYEAYKLEKESTQEYRGVTK
jgi:hypothetical protein